MRYTIKDLERKVELLNKLTDSPLNAVSNRQYNIGNFHLSECYGGVELHRIVNSEGGISVESIGGHVTKRELYYQLSGMVHALTLRTHELVTR